MRKSNTKIFLTKGENDGQQVWHYVKIDMLKQPLFNRALQSGTIDVAQYGEVLVSGWGEKPPADIVQMIEKKYG